MGKHLGKCSSVGGRGRSRAEALAIAGGGKGRNFGKDGTAETTSYLQLRSRALVLTPKLQRRRRRRSPWTTSPCEKPEAVVSGTVGLERAASRGDTNYCGEVVEEKQEQWARSNWGGQEDRGEQGCLESHSCNFAHRCNSEGRSKRREPTPSSELRGVNGEAAVEFDNLEPRNEAAAGRPTRTKPAQMTYAAEIEEFFAAAEKEQMKKFVEKYNYDVVKDVPVEGGRYEWVKIAP